MKNESDNTADVRLERTVSLSVYKTIVELHHDLVVAMQAAWIEWKHGRGADAGMQWIENTLDGPGFIPNDDEPYGKEAQFYFSANCAHPMGPCAICGKPSCTIGSGIAACGTKHFIEAGANGAAGNQPPAHGDGRLD